MLLGARSTVARRARPSAQGRRRLGVADRLRRACADAAAGRAGLARAGRSVRSTRSALLTLALLGALLGRVDHGADWGDADERLAVARLAGRAGGAAAAAARVRSVARRLAGARRAGGLSHRSAARCSPPASGSGRWSPTSPPTARAAPLPHLPLLNPLDIGVAPRAGRDRCSGCARVGRRAAAARWRSRRAGFVWLNAILVRGFHHYGGVPYRVDAWLDSLAVQTGIALLWTLTALVAMWFGARRGAACPGSWARRCSPRWCVKLLLVDLSGTGTRDADRLLHRRRRADAGDRLRRAAAGQGGRAMLRPERIGASRRVALRRACSSAAPRSRRRAAEPQPYRYAAPIEIAQPAPFVEMALPPAAYAHARRPTLRDLRLVDARRRARAASRCSHPTPWPRTQRAAARGDALPLAAAAAGSAAWPSPVRSHRSTATGSRCGAPAAGALSASARRANRPGWLIDLRRASRRPSRRRGACCLRWSGPAEFSAAYAIETSADLRSWRGARGRPGDGAAVVEPARWRSRSSACPMRPGRFVRLTWLDPAECAGAHRRGLGRRRPGPGRRRRGATSSRSRRARRLPATGRPSRAARCISISAAACR